MKNLIIKDEDGRVIKLSDIAEVSLSKSHDAYRALGNNKESVVVAVGTTPSANPLEVMKGINKLLPTIDNNLPSALKSTIIYDSTIAIDESINQVLHTILEAVIIVLIVITLFLGNFRAVLIPIITIPISLVGVCIVMYALGFSINLMTLLAMVLAIGLVVDDAIVVVENVNRHIVEKKASAFDAAIYGTREIAVPVISMTLALGAVYAPIALMGGLTGSLFTEFALTLAGSVFVSGFIALTLSPVMSAYLLKDGDKDHENKFEDLVNKVFLKITTKYKNSLNTVIKNRSAIYLFAVVVFCSIPALFGYISSELAPAEDKGVFLMQSTAPNAANLDYIQKNVEVVGESLVVHEDVGGFVSMVGVPSSNKGLIIANLKPWSEREKSQQEVSEEIKDSVKDMVNIETITFAVPELPGASSGLPIQVSILTSENRELLFDVSKNIKDKIVDTGLFVYDSMDLAYDTGKLKIEVDREKAGIYGVTMESIGQTLSTMITDGYINRIAIDGKAYEVILQTKRVDRQNPSLLEHYYVKSLHDEMIPLKELISYSIVSEPRTLPKLNQLNSVTISLVPSPVTTMGAAIEEIEKIIKEELPQGYTYDYQGESRQFVQEGNALYVTFALALCMIFLILAIQFESLKDPLVILTTVPLAVSGSVNCFGMGCINFEHLFSNWFSYIDRYHNKTWYFNL